MSNTGPDDRQEELVNRLQEEVAGLRRSRRRLAQSGYTDRRAIERELHDGVQQDLVALAVNLQRLAGLVDDPIAARVLLGELAAIVQEAIDQATELARLVNPPLLEGRGLASAIRAAAERAGVTVVVEVSALADYPPDVAAAVYWSCVEVLSAASAGSQAAVSVHDEDGGLAVEISIAGHLGDERLERLRDRVEALHGRLGVEDAPGGGAHVHGWLPSSP